MCLLFYRDSIVYFRCSHCLLLLLLSSSSPFYGWNFRIFSEFNVPRCAKNEEMLRLYLHLMLVCKYIRFLYAPIEIQIFPSKSRFAFIIFAFMKIERKNWETYLRFQSSSSLPSFLLLLFLSSSAAFIFETKWNDNKIKSVSISWYSERKYYLFIASIASEYILLPFIRWYGKEKL